MKNELKNGSENPDNDGNAPVYPLATKAGIEMMFALLIESGSMCPRCGYATRVTSKRWAKCKNCGERVARN